MADGELVDELAAYALAAAGEELKGVERGADVVARLVAQGYKAAHVGVYVGC